MEQQLRRNTANSNDTIYETLRVYLMLGDLRHFDPESVTAWLDYYWSHNLNEADPNQLTMLSNHAQALMEQFGHSSHPLPLNADLISEARLSLASMTIPQRVYNRLKRELLRSKLPEFSVSDSAGHLADQVLVQHNGEPLTRGINGMYTLAGYQQFKARNPQGVADIVQDSWVLAQQEKIDADHTEQVKADVMQLYFTDYIAHWDALLANVGVAPFGTLDQGARIVSLASGPDSPVRQFLQAASQQTTLTATAAPAGESIGIKNKLEKYKQKLENVLGSDTNDAPVAVLVNPVDAHFDALHKMTFTPPGGNSTLDAVLSTLKDMALYLDASATARRTGVPAPAGDVVNKLKLTADSLPPPLAQMLKEISNGASGLTSGSERQRLNSLWSAKAGPFCKIAIAGRYPLARNSNNEVTADDFGKFFAPNGLMDDFFTKNLLPYVDMGGKQWHWRSTPQNTSLGISQQVLDNFQRAARIRDAFFVAGGNQPSMRFELKPVNIDPSLTSLSLDIGGQKLINVSNASGVTAQDTPFILPSGKENSQVQFKAMPALHGDWHTAGSWAWFRMTDKGVQESTDQPERYRLVFNLDGKKAVFELTASSVINPYQRDALEQFHCMDKLQ